MPHPISMLFRCLFLASIAQTASAISPPIPNGGFELGTAGRPESWVWQSASQSFQAEWADAAAHAGRRAIRIRVPGELNTEVGWTLNCTAPVPIAPGPYVVSFWLKAKCDRLVTLSLEGCQGDKLVKPRLGDDANGHGRQGAVRGFGPCDWTRFERAIVVPAGVSTLRMKFAGKYGSDLLIDDVEIRPGTIARHACPAPVRGHAKQRTEEKLDRGMVAIRCAQGVYVSWRLLRDDPADIAFRIERRTDGKSFAPVCASPVARTTDFLDRTPEAARATAYRLSVVRTRAPQEPVVCRVETCEPGPSYRAIRLVWPGDPPAGDIEKVGVGDLDGDGRWDYVLKHPKGDVLLYDDYTRWKRSPATYKIDGFTADGTHLWRRDLSWGIEHRNWFSPMLVWDLDGDGRAEVITKAIDGDPRSARGRVIDGPEWLVVWDGLTGQEIARAPWPSRAGFECFNFASRNQLAVAYLDGRTPSIVVVRGTYGLMKVDAWELVGHELRPLWKYCNANAPDMYWGQGAHFTQCVDVDGDGRDEVALGSLVLDDTGAPLWSTGKGHPDGLFIGEIDPLHPGLEMFTHIESRRATGGMLLVDAATGNTLWELETPTVHVHGGMCDDVDPEHPGLECYAADKKPVDGKDQIIGTWFRTASGRPLTPPTDWSYRRPTVYWDADPQKELIFGGTIRKFRGDAQWTVPNHAFVPIDLVGDWREELLVFTPDELRLYLSTVPAGDRRVCLMQDRIYRADIAMCAMAYHRPAMLSCCPAAAASPPR